MSLKDLGNICIDSLTRPFFIKDRVQLMLLDATTGTAYLNKYVTVGSLGLSSA